MTAVEEARKLAKLVEMDARRGELEPGAARLLDDLIDSVVEQQEREEARRI
jgi:hypothetical protein